MLAELDTYDWKEAFKYARPKVCEAGHDHGPRQTIGSDVSIDPFYRNDVAEIISMQEGEKDGESWIAVFCLKDGRFASLRASCDYTGWG